MKEVEREGIEMNPSVEGEAQGREFSLEEVQTMPMGVLFRTYRERHGAIDKAELARKLGVKPSTIGKHEAGVLRMPNKALVENFISLQGWEQTDMRAVYLRLSIMDQRSQTHKKEK